MARRKPYEPGSPNAPLMVSRFRKKEPKKRSESQSSQRKSSKLENKTPQRLIRPCFSPRSILTSPTEMPVRHAANFSLIRALQIAFLR